MGVSNFIVLAVPSVERTPDEHQFLLQNVVKQFLLLTNSNLLHNMIVEMFELHIFNHIYCRCEIFSYWLNSQFRAVHICQHRFCTTVGEIFITFNHRARNRHNLHACTTSFLCVVAWLFLVICLRCCC